MQKSSGTLYWYGGGSDVLYETDLSGANGRDYIFFGGRRLARYDETPQTIYHYFEDHLGSSRVIVQSTTNTPCYDADFGPYGKEAVYTNTCGQNYKFTGKERDAETGNDNFGARYYENNLGRFMSADPKNFSGRFLANPQKWNKYTYVLNNPLGSIDPDGKEEITFTVKTAINYKTTWMFGTYKGGPKTTATFRVETDPHKASNPLLGSPKETVHETTQVFSAGEISKTGSPTATAEGFRSTLGDAVINFQQDTKNPLAPVPQFLTPGVSANLTFIVSPDAQHILILGSTSSYPSFEIDATHENGKTEKLYSSDPLFNSTILLFSNNSVFVNKEEKKKEIIDRAPQN